MYVDFILMRLVWILLSLLIRRSIIKVQKNAYVLFFLYCMLALHEIFTNYLGMVRFPLIIAFGISQMKTPFLSSFITLNGPSQFGLKAPPSGFLDPNFIYLRTKSSTAMFFGLTLEFEILTTLS